ncbi:MAG: LamG domain-containing protein [Verrucomicrobiota bacterium]|jgi:hypothetical protein
MWILPGTARANPLNSTNFTSLGALALTTGNYLIDTSGGNPVLLDSASNVLYTGVIYNQGGIFDSNVAVFAFSSIVIGVGVTITPSGDNPVALLSRGSIDLAGTINASGTNGGNQGDGFGGAGGPGGGGGGVGSGGSGQGPGGGGGGFGGLGNGSWGDGGSFGGQGAGWNPSLPAAPTYGDLTAYLQGGSGGGASGANLFGTGAGGGGGGGAVELGAGVAITLESTAGILVPGGLGGGGEAINTGGGSGGGVFLHAATVTFNGAPLVNASGDGGGRIAFLTQSGTVSGNLQGLEVTGSAFGNPGVITFGVLVGEAAQIAILGQPQSVVTYTGNTVNLTASGITGSIPITFQWLFDGRNLTNGGNISGAQTSTLTITDTTTTNVGTYQLLLTNPAGTTPSSNATVAVVSPVPGSYEAAVLAGKPFAFWKLNETNDPSAGGVVAYDYMGGHNGTYQTAAQNGFNGIVGPETPAFPGFPANNAALATFHGVANSYVAASAGSLIATNLTYAMWIKPNEPVENYAGLLMDRGGPGAGFDFGGTVDGNGMSELGYLWNQGNPDTWSWDSMLFPPAQQWSFVAMVIEPTQATLYLINNNGAQSATNAITHDSETFSVAYHIGDDNFGNNPGARTFPGSIADVSVYLSALSSSQLTALYNAGLKIGQPVTLYITSSGKESVTLNWSQGTLLQSTKVIGPWSTNTAASPCSVETTNALMFYKVLVQ